MSRSSMIIVPAVLLSIAAVAPAAAQIDSRASYSAIIGGDLTAAERMLAADRRIYPQRSEVLLNLAAIYATTGRAALARSLYEQVLASDDTVMDLSGDRTATAHAIARTGMRRIAQTQTASR